ncbi:MULTISPECIES: STAS domain-containing protein [Clostridium]|jgi:Anti-anti-sigma regulatory factor (antagonist of anti-sigma factor)|uniref:Anti-sigma factor antagonist n=5 Tax=Clostridium TaxID=1485 RepID=A0A0B5QGL2_CLOBE|nr:MULTISPECIES: STAS domain-containing protein [Clostridium]ABR32855.1 anti-sigma-factor antagonist [Clostridium beijerinckii NCIMB 8052]AIU03900.1 anti-sigma-factor antagonist [Clostridium beijerinckii ATCC 35702]AJG97371.1 anti-anti-sigma factor [Clostridium beijerinckii]ALB48013.1 anti-sigma factor antagonist [Clostridium beijerinckii NRRL B-598]AVK49733.1 anti-anti-sigma factor [Clostridium sp. MF28]
MEISIPKDFVVDEVANFRVKVNKLIDEGQKNFIFNFNDCNFIDSTGLGALVAVYKKCAEKNGSIKLKGLKPEVEKLFKLTRLDKVFEICP